MYCLKFWPIRKNDRARPKGRRRKTLREGGATSVILVILIPVLFGALALALDFGKVVYERQNLANAMDAASLAGASALPSDLGKARSTAISYAKSNAPGSDPVVSFWCIVASTGATKTVVSGQVPTVCNPGSTAGARCNESICAIPCPAVSGNHCNTITVEDAKEVSLNFAPVIGINTKNTGAVAANACKGPCGAQVPNPMDVALVADRTGSMSTGDRNAMVAGIKGTLQTMTKEQQYVALGTIHQSKKPASGCVTSPSSNNSGTWLPVGFSNDYALAPVTPGAKPALNTDSTLVKGLNCLASSSGGTHLAAPMKAAARYVLGKEANNLSSLPTRSTTARKAIIFETDGEPNESSISSGTTSLNNAGDIGSTNGVTACNNLKTVAANAKAEGVLIVTVAFGDATSARCEGSSSAYVRDVLAAAASPKADGSPSTSNNCGSDTARAAENSDGDFFFCAANGDELGTIFASAINAISPNTHLLRIPN